MAVPFRPPFLCPSVRLPVYLSVCVNASLPLATEIPHNAVRDLNVLPLPAFPPEAGILQKTIWDASGANPKRIGLKGGTPSTD